MNKTKTIYFLSAIVLIIGCYALNLSYSLFVQTESKDIVNATVPVLSYNLEQSEFTIPARSSELVILTVNNAGTTGINYGISTTLQDGVTAQLVDKTDNNITGTLDSSSSADVALYVTNNNEIDKNISFNVTANYSTVALANDFADSSNIDVNNKKGTLGDEIIAKAQSNDLSYENKTVYSTSYITVPAEQINDSNERLLLETEDNYTASTGRNSYYFRGTVIDNYVNFAGKCWRIVRVEGDGSVKLILEDQNQTCDSKDNSGNLNMDGDWALSSLDGSTNAVSYGYSLYPIGSLEASDGTTNAAAKHIADYLHGITSGDVAMAPILKAFQNSFSDGELKKLKTGDWCLGDSGYTDDNLEQPLTEQQKKDKIVKKERYYYESYIKLSGNYGFNPTLKCSGTILEHFDDADSNQSGIPTPMYAGSITAFEAVYAGLSFVDQGCDNYLYSGKEKANEISEQYVLSVYQFNGTGDYTVKIWNSTGLMQNIIRTAGSGVRPAISVKYAVATANEDYATYGYPGTQTNPYVIK